MFTYKQKNYFKSMFFKQFSVKSDYDHFKYRLCIFISSLIKVIGNIFYTNFCLLSVPFRAENFKINGFSYTLRAATAFYDPTCKCV